MNVKCLYDFSDKHVSFFLLLTTGFVLLVYAGSDVILPAMLSVVQEMHADGRHVANAFNLYLLGGIAFQWLIGSLADYFGRRPLLLSGLLLFALTFIAACFSQQIEGFNLLRFIQGTAIGFVLVVVYPIIQEMFAEDDAVRLMALMSNIALLSPLLGPLAGSLLLQWFSWRVLFLGIGLIALAVLAGLWRWMPETLGVVRKDGAVVDAVPLRVGKTVGLYISLWREYRFISGTVALGLFSLPLVAWVGMSPLLLMATLGYSQTTYALLQFPVFGGVIAGTLLLNALASRYSLRRLFFIALVPSGAGAVGLGLFSCFAITLPWMILLLALYAMGLGFGSSILYRLTLFSVRSGRGYAAAMLGMLSTAVIVVGIAILTRCDAATAITRFSADLALCAMLAIIPLGYFFKNYVGTAESSAADC
ncbi:MFS transporter [Kalamiella sp. sgz302252]|uniref:MFS transporter n=1 Tax=Pantoea sp. sgz302252 TaxID=3341827 RepID=UPI0036D2709D